MILTYSLSYPKSRDAIAPKKSITFGSETPPKSNHQFFLWRSSYQKKNCEHNHIPPLTIRINKHRFPRTLECS